MSAAQLTWEIRREHSAIQRAKIIAEVAFADFVNIDRLGTLSRATVRIAEVLEMYAAVDVPNPEVPDQKTKDLLIKIGDGASPEVFTNVAALRATQLSLNATQVDLTNADSTDQWRELLAGGGVKTASVTGSGVFKDAASDAALRTAFFNQAVGNFQLTVPSFGTITGPFKIASLQYDGPYDGELKLSLSLASAGAMRFERA